MVYNSELSKWSISNKKGESEGFAFSYIGLLLINPAI